MENKRLFLSLSQEDVDRLDKMRNELGMNRSQFVRYLLTKNQGELPNAIRYQDIYIKLSEINVSLRAIAVGTPITGVEKLQIHEYIKRIEEFLKSGNITFSPMDQK